MRALFCDIGSSNLGWAFGGPDESPSHGCYHPPKTGANLGWLVVDIEAFLIPLIADNCITTIAYESPVLYHDNSLMTLRHSLFLPA